MIGGKLFGPPRRGKLNYNSGVSGLFPKTNGQRSAIAEKEMQQQPIEHSHREGATRVPSREQLMDAAQVGEWLGVSRGWVLDHASGRRRPHLKSIKLGKSVRFRPADVEAFLTECSRIIAPSPGNSLERRYT